MSDLDLDLDLDIDLEDLEGLEVSETADEVQYRVIPATFKSSKTEEILGVFYLTDNMDTAMIFNPDVDQFSSYNYFLLPYGTEVKNHEVLSQFELGAEMYLTEVELRNSAKEEFNWQYLKAMLEN